MKKLAFTLAEMLICISLLGFVIALFLPSIRNDENQDKFYEVQYAKVFNDIFTVSQAVLVVDFKSLRDYKGMGADEIRNSFANHLDVANIWTGNIQNTWTSTARGAVAQIQDINDNVLEGMTLNNGVQLAFWINSNISQQTINRIKANTNLSNIPTDNLMGVLFIDINGKASPNILNKDQYVIPFYTDGIRNNISYKN